MAEIIQELQKICDFEKTLKKAHCGTSIAKVEINGDMKFNVDGQAYNAQISRSLIHQLGSRLWKTKQNDFNAINDLWRHQYVSNKEQLQTEIENKLKETNAILLLDSKNRNVYGIISDQFIEINPIEFRTKFIEAYKDSGHPQNVENTLERTHFGEIIERYTFNEIKQLNGNEPIKYGLHIIYGLNNGYSSYRVRLGRTVLVCTNGLTHFEGITAQFKHTRHATIPEFIRDIKENILSYDNKFQLTINEAKNRNIDVNSFNELFKRLHVSTVVKNRIKERFEIEKSVSGNNEWSLSQAFTNVASHIYNNAAEKYHNEILTFVGSNVLDESMESILDLNVKEEAYGDQITYGILLPKDFHKN